LSKRLTLADLLADAVTRYGSQMNVARVTGINRTRINKFLNRATDADESLELANCFRLAIALGKPAKTVLLATGKAEVLPLLEQLFGAGLTPQAPTYPNLLMEVSTDERDVIEALRAVKAQNKEVSHG
jgi:hypothetical protein